MEFLELKMKAIEIKDLYKDIEIESMGKPWSIKERTEGLVVDVGELMELIMAKSGARKYKGSSIDSDIAHELSDIMWAVLVLSEELNIDIEKEFGKNMSEIKKNILLKSQMEGV